MSSFFEGQTHQLNEFLKLISPKPLIIGPTDGSEVLADASDLFARIDVDFRNWNADEPGESTGETPVDVYEMVKDATFAQMFQSLASDVSRLCLTQAQIKEFVRHYCDWLRTDGYPTFFLFKSRNQFFVASVYVSSFGGLGVGVYEFECSGVRGVRDRLRLLAPPLA